VISLSRNFGHQPALTAALDYATGDAVIVIDGDLQDPPEIIPGVVGRTRLDIKPQSPAFQRKFDVQQPRHPLWNKKLQPGSSRC